MDNGPVWFGFLKGLWASKAHWEKNLVFDSAFATPFGQMLSFEMLKAQSRWGPAFVNVLYLYKPILIYDNDTIDL